jgi:ribosome production factor 1
MATTTRHKRPSEITNKQKREELYHELKKNKSKLKAQRYVAKKPEDVTGETKRISQKTLENTREIEETFVDINDPEIVQDEACDELAAYYQGRSVKLLLTTSKKAIKEAYTFIRDLVSVFPGSEFKDRGNYSVKEIIEFCNNRDYTDILLVNEDRKKLQSITIIHLPDGPTAHFRLTNIIPLKHVKGHGRPTEDYPELVLNNFNTRLGHTIGRMLAALFPQQPGFEARQVVTFHNQRDFIFFRRHRYMFDEDGKRVKLQEIGPRFTLKLQYLQKGAFDTKFGEYEWLRKAEKGVNRRRFFL